MKYFDCHVHVSPEAPISFLPDFLDRTETDCAVLQAVYHSAAGPLAPMAMEFKRAFPDRFKVFGAPDASLYRPGSTDTGRKQLEYLKPLFDAGMDGLKLLEGKPQMRKARPVPDFDAEEWEPLWEYLERERIPVLWHVNDPDTFWDPNPSPWLLSIGWHYDESFINNEVQYAQVLNVLERHPGLKVIFAHFFFMSSRLERLSAILDRFPFVCVDLTPGIEMYESFSAAPETAAAFFEKYGDRICYGTDIGGRCILTSEGQPFNIKENLRRPKIVREFLRGTAPSLIESDGDYLVDRAPFTLRPLGLMGDRLEKICHGNIERLISR